MSEVVSTNSDLTADDVLDCSDNYHDDEISSMSSSSMSRDELLKLISVFEYRFGVCTLGSLVMANFVNSTSTRTAGLAYLDEKFLALDQVVSNLQQIAQSFGIENVYDVNELWSARVELDMVLSHMTCEEQGQAIEAIWHNYNMFEEVDAYLLRRNRRAWLKTFI